MRGQLMTRQAGAPRVFHLTARDGALEEIYGVRLGRASSQETVHHHTQKFAEVGQKCRACRWFEVEIFRLTEPDGPGDYIIHTVGHSDVPGEITKARIIRSSDAAALIDALV